MSSFTDTDKQFMRRAAELAWQGLYTAHPNPMVGCVIVRDGETVGEGWHKIAGGAHAEVNALRDAGGRAHGATAYVTLEPCCHLGRTPPCTDALIEAGVAEVVIGVEDPNPAVDGGGISALDKAGITTRVGVLEDVVSSQLSGFLSRIRRGRPFVRLKMACSLDGCIAMANGQSQWITGTEARGDVQRLRARSGAIVSGIGTVLADDPSLTVRDPGIDLAGRQPLRAILDSRLRMPLAAEMLALDGHTVVYCASDSKQKALHEAGAEVVRVASIDGKVSAVAVLEDLAARGINDVLVEAGPLLAGNLISNELVDELVIYQAPHIMGSETMGMFRTPGWTELADRKALDIIDVTRVGPDTRLTATFVDD